MLVVGLLAVAVGRHALLRVVLVVVLVDALGRLDEAVPHGLALDLLVREEGEVVGRLDVRHVLDVALGEDDVDLLEGPVRRLRVEEPDDGQEAGVDHREEEVCAPAWMRVVSKRGRNMGPLKEVRKDLPMLAIMMGVTMTMRKLNSQFVHVDTALALARVLMGFTSAG